jgi:uncharacterized membrane protein SpoIIM required for sporulation
MFELLINPKRAEREPWQMFIIGFFYAFLSLVIAKFAFGSDPVLSKYIGMFVLVFCVMVSLPFMYYTIRLEERKDVEYGEEGRLLKEHGRAIYSFLWLFMGFVVAFSIGYALFPHGETMFKAQIETFCQINRPSSFDDCVKQYGIETSAKVTGAITSKEKFVAIFSNNVYVLIFTIIFSLVFGAGAIFILAWNATVIAAAIGIFMKSEITRLPLGLLRYMIHGLPEIAAYFIAALAGGIISIAVIRRDTDSERFLTISEDALMLIIIAMIILAISAFIEVFITPKLF